MHCLAHGWQLVDALATGAVGSNGIEFGYVLRKSAGSCDAGRFLADRQAWVAATSAARADADELTARVAALESSTSWRVTAPLRSLSARLRQLRTP